MTNKRMYALEIDGKLGRLLYPLARAEETAKHMVEAGIACEVVEMCRVPEERYVPLPYYFYTPEKHKSALDKVLDKEMKVVRKYCLWGIGVLTLAALAVWSEFLKAHIYAWMVG